MSLSIRLTVQERCRQSASRALSGAFAERADHRAHSSAGSHAVVMGDCFVRRGVPATHRRSNFQVGVCEVRYRLTKTSGGFVCGACVFIQLPVVSSHLP